mgnify:FL=1
MKTTVDAYLCPRCDTLVFSRARHDYRHCPCGDIAVDGGLDYSKVTYKHDFPKNVRHIVEASEQELYDDWNRRDDKLGLILDYSNLSDTSSTKTVI